MSAKGQKRTFDEAAPYKPEIKKPPASSAGGSGHLDAGDLAGTGHGTQMFRN